MKDIQVFEIAPALGNPWYIESIDLDADRNRDIRVDFKKNPNPQAKFLTCVRTGFMRFLLHLTGERSESA